MAASLGYHIRLLMLIVSVCAAVRQTNDNSKLVNHDDDGEHNVEFDHQAFLGGEKAAKEFEELSEIESKKKLVLIVQKIDKNNDTFVSTDEMVNWLEESFKKIDRDDSIEIFGMQDKNQDSMVSWDEYLEFVFGFVPGKDHKPELTYQKEILRNEKRYHSSDLNGDGTLNEEEYLSFHNPRTADHMKNVVIEQILMDLDFDDSKAIDLQEFLGDFYKPDDGISPDWVKDETYLFNSILDVNKDGLLQGDEIYAWVSPRYKENAIDEAHHLLKEADDDEDGNFSLEEILNHYDVFAGSHVTHYGQSLKPNSLFHEEL